jgi:phospholipid/cholesterol/gamma-HCH transport system ATP-binding protein
MNKALGHTSIIVSHDIKETMSIADHIFLISGGEVIAQGTPKELSKNHLPQVEQFMQGQPDGPVPFHYSAQPLLDDLGLAEGVS